jgi:hypothetical protein
MKPINFDAAQWRIWNWKERERKGKIHLASLLQFTISVSVESWAEKGFHIMIH